MDFKPTDFTLFKGLQKLDQLQNYHGFQSDWHRPQKGNNGPDPAQIFCNDQKVPTNKHTNANKRWALSWL